MRYSIWTATDPLSGYNPIFEVEHYFDGEHNGGLENSFNHATYSYCYQSPVVLLDPDGKQVKSKYLDDTWLGDYGFSNSFGNGIADGMIDASPVGLVVFIKDILTKPEVREQLWQGINDIIDDPSGTVQKLFAKKIETWSNVLNGGGTEQEKYNVGNDIGNTLGALITGGGLKKLFDQLKKKGVVYRRTDLTGGQKPYIGQAKSKTRFEARKKEHGRANPDADYEFEIIGRAKPGKKLDKLENKELKKAGGPTNKSNPNGGTSNKKWVIKPEKKKS